MICARNSYLPVCIRVIYHTHYLLVSFFALVVIPRTSVSVYFRWNLTFLPFPQMLHHSGPGSRNVNGRCPCWAGRNWKDRDDKGNGFIDRLAGCTQAREFIQKKTLTSVSYMPMVSEPQIYTIAVGNCSIESLQILRVSCKIIALNANQHNS